MKKLFGGIDLTWKKLIIFAIIAGVYTALMAMLPFTKDTSFRDIAIMFEWWILFGIIIISNSKNPVDSALKCFIFFLISQPLVYLIQVPFSSMGWDLFGYYRYWFYWTLACLPMGFIGYYITKKNYLSIIILLPMFIGLIMLGIGYIINAIGSFPHHLLSGISCFAIIIVVTLFLFDELKYKLITFAFCIIAIISIIIFGIYKSNLKFETYRILDSNEYVLVGDVYVTYFAGTDEGYVEVIKSEAMYSVKLTGYKGAEYEFTITDENDNEYSFEYHYDKDSKSVVLNKIQLN